MIKKRILTVGLDLPLYGNKSSLIISLEPTTDGENFLLNPVSYERKTDPKQQTTQWYLKFIGSLKIKLDLFWQPNNKWNPSNISLTYSQENPLTLILEEGKAETSWILRQGSIQVPLSLNAPGDNILQSLWPTGEIKNISALVIQSGGLYFQGQLPQPFYPDPATRKDVLLRIPQTKEDTNDPANLGNVTAYFWTLDALPFGENHTAVKHIKGFAEAKGEVVITMDADLQDSPDEIPALRSMILEEGYHVVSGWKKKRYDPLSKTIPTKLFNWATRKISDLELHDFNCGLKAYRNEVVKNIEVYGEMHRYIPVIAKWAGFPKIGEKVVVHQARKYGHTKFGMNRFVNGFLDLMSLFFMSKFGKKPMHFFGLLGVLSFLIGAFTACWILIDKLIYVMQSKRAPLVTDNPLFYFGVVS